MNQKRRSRGGFTIGEMIIAGALLSLAASMAAQVMFQIFETSQSLGESEVASVTVDGAVAAMRRDVEHATSIHGADGGITLDAAAWAFSDRSLTRTVAGKSQTFAELPQPAAINVMGSIVTLQLADAKWTFVPLTDQPSGGRR